MKFSKFALTSAMTCLQMAADADGSDTGGTDAGDTAVAETKTAKTVYESVKMDDDRVVEFPGKRRVLKSVVIEDNVAKVRFDFRNGETRIFSVPTDLLLQFAAHGASQKLGDCFAGVKELDDAIQTYDETAHRLSEGKWTEESTGGTNAGSSILQKALMEVTGKSAEDIRAFLASKTPKEKMALRGNPKIKPTVDRLEAEKAARQVGKAKDQVDTSEMLGALGLNDAE